MVLIANPQLTFFKCSTPVNEFLLTGLVPHHLCQGFSVMGSSVPASSRWLAPHPWICLADLHLLQAGFLERMLTAQCVGH